MCNSIKKVLSPIYRFFFRIWFGLRNEWTLSNFIIRCKYRKVFRELKNTHKGERCFIIGNGPSLTADDLTLLKDEYTFAANRIYYMFDKTPWRPTYYCAQDIVVVDDIISDLPKVARECKKMFLISACYKQVDEELRNNSNVLFFVAKYVSAHKERLFSDDVEKYVSGGGSITYAAIQLAVYMGFSEIYLIGVDHNYAATSFKDNHVSTSDVAGSYFEGMPTNIKMTKPNTDNATLSFMKAKEYCDSRGIKIVNATRGGKLEVFPRVNLEVVLGK